MTDWGSYAYHPTSLLPQSRHDLVQPSSDVIMDTMSGDYNLLSPAVVNVLVFVTNYEVL